MRISRGDVVTTTTKASKELYVPRNLDLLIHERGDALFRPAKIWCWQFQNATVEIRLLDWRNPKDFLLLRVGGRFALFQMLRLALADAAKRAGCTDTKPISPHRLRHSWATELLNYGIGLPTLMKLMGHKCIQMTLPYLKVTQPDLRREFYRARQNSTQSYRLPSVSVSTATSDLLHDLLAELVIPSLLPQPRQRLSHLLLLHFLARHRRPGGRRPGGGKAQRPRIELEQPRLGRRGVAKLEAQLHGGGEMRRRRRQEQVRVAHGVQRRGAAEGAADLIAPDRFAHVMHHDECRFGSIAQPQQALAQRRHGARIVLIPWRAVSSNSGCDTPAALSCCVR